MEIETQNPGIGTPDPGSGVDGTGGAGGSSDKTVPYTRFKEVNDTVAAYKQLVGSPDDLANMMANYETLQQAIAAGALAPEVPDIPKPIVSGDEQRAVEKLRKLMPELNTVKELPALIAALQAQTDSVSKQSLNGLKRQASENVQARLIEDGYIADTPPADEKAREDNDKLSAGLEDVVANMIFNDQKAKQRFEAGDLAVVGEAYDAMTAIFSPKLARFERAKSKLPGLFTGRTGAAKMPLSAEISQENLAKMPAKEAEALLTKHAFATMRAMSQESDTGWG